MTVKENETLVRHYFRDFNLLKGDSSKFNDTISKKYFAADITAHYSSGDLTLEQYTKYGMSLVIAFPDLQQNIEDILAQGDRVAARITLRGTHKGSFSGVPATGREANIQAALICRISKNKIAEVWAFPNELGLLRQLGIIPTGISRS
jgi:steroid delta-isomerase-like uncharacterized protein